MVGTTQSSRFYERTLKTKNSAIWTACTQALFVWAFCLHRMTAEYFWLTVKRLWMFECIDHSTERFHDQKLLSVHFNGKVSLRQSSKAHSANRHCRSVRLANPLKFQCYFTFNSYLQIDFKSGSFFHMKMFHFICNWICLIRIDVMAFHRWDTASLRAWFSDDRFVCRINLLSSW